LPVLASSLGIDPAHPRISYAAEGISLLGSGQNIVSGVAKFNVFAPAISTDAPPLGIVVSAGDSAQVNVTLDLNERKLTPPTGLMFGTPDNRNGPDEAQLIRLFF